MALSNFTELKTAVADYLIREDDTALAARLDDLVRLCEVRFNRRLRIESMIASESVTVTNDQASLPLGFKEARTVYVDANPNVALEYLTPFKLKERYNSPSAGLPCHYTIEGTNIVLPEGSGAETIELLYYRAFDGLSDANTANWMLDNAPDVYLYGTLQEAKPYLEDYEDLAIWASMYEAAITDLEDEDKRSKRSGSPLVMTPEFTAENRRRF